MATSPEDGAFALDANGHRERQSLLPWNRRVRHLHGVSVRNLDINPPGRVRGKTITDDQVPFTLRSPTKSLAKSETRALQHSQSFSSLKFPGGEHLQHLDKSSTSYGELASPGERPRLGKSRRRSTLQWSGSSPGIRQKKLEDATVGRMVDSWFSLHVHDGTDPVYISEEIHKAMNPSFRAFDLHASGPEITRADNMTLKLWVRPVEAESYTLLVELRSNLRSLQYIGKALDNFHHPLPTNCVLFHMQDGIYTSFTDMPAVEFPIGFLRARHDKSTKLGEQSTSSFDALMRLANLDDCVQDALAVRETIEAQFNAIIDEQHTRLSSVRKVAQAEDAADHIWRTCVTQQRQIRGDKKRKDEIKAGLKSRRAAMQAAREEQDKTSYNLREVGAILHAAESNIAKLVDVSAGQVRRICEDLQRIYPIEAVPDKPLQFTIRGLPLPNSKFDDIEDKDSLAAALGFTTHLLTLLSHHLSVPLPYPVQHLASTSLIEDPISVALNQRIYPLYPTSVTYRFEYGVFLLNKNIEFLMERHNLRMLDIRHTLPNIKYLLYVLTAGTGEIPARKAGGVKGLITGRMSPTLSRQSSEDSLADNTGSWPRGSTNLLLNKHWEKEGNNILRPMLIGAKPDLTFRTRALRSES